MDELNGMNYGTGDDTSDSGSDEPPQQPISRVTSARNGGTGRASGLASSIYGPKTQQETVRTESALEFAERCVHIPMRLTEEERKLLAVLENALDVCEYTDTVDVTFSHTRKSKQARIMESLVDVLSISCGLLMSNNLTKGSAALTWDQPLICSSPSSCCPFAFRRGATGEQAAARERGTVCRHLRDRSAV